MPEFALPDTSLNSRSEISYFDKIDVIRFISAMIVVVYHSYQGWVNKIGLPEIITEHGDKITLTTIGQWVHLGIMNGGYGVEAFFIISGFLITYILLNEKELNQGRINFLNFYTRRSLRIWPLYYFIISLSPLIVNWIGQKDSPDYVANIFFYNNFRVIHDPDSWLFPLAHFWTLCIEEHFYIVWPLIIAFVPNKYLIRTFILLILISIVYRGCVFLYVDEPWYYLFMSTFSRYDALVVGAATAYFHFIRPIKLTISKPLRIAVYLVLTLAITNDNTALWNNLFMACFKKYFYMAMVLFAMLNFLFNDKPMLEFLNNKVIRYLGKISFGIYVYGLIINELVLQKLVHSNGVNTAMVYWLLVLSCSLIIPVISYELFEKQFLKLKKRFEVVRIIKN